MAKSRTLHALLVAIDKYPIPHHRLNGCVNDRNAFKTYLEAQASDELALNIKTLTDDEATKQHIIDGFGHFQDAKDGDICVFYFSGHGSRAPAPREFWHLDPDQMNESVVCWDSRTETGKDLMDKELSYLLWQAQGKKDLHFLAVFDCCHSGTITKDLSAAGEDLEIRARMAEPSPTPSTIQDYHGSEAYQKVELNGETQYSPPQGRIVQLAASKDSETAKELRIMGRPRGIFTYNLIELLEQNGGQVPYGELVKALQVRVANKVREQTPQLITFSAEAKKLFFLGGAAQPKPPYFTVQHHKGKWLLDAGAVQGIPTDGGTLKLEDGTEIEIAAVEANRSEISGMDDRDPNQVFKAFASGIAFRRVALAFAENGQQEGEKVLRQLFEERQPAYLELTGKARDAQYWIHAVEDGYRLTLPNEERPVFRRVEGQDEAGASVFLGDVEAVAQWRNLLDLANPRSTIRDDEYELTLYRLSEAGNFQDDATADPIDWSEDNVFAYDYIDKEWRNPAFRFKVKNTGRRTLYFSTLYMADNFGITNQFMDRQELQPGQEAWMTEVVDGFPYRTIPLWVDDAYHSWGVTEIVEYLKILISTDPRLDTDSYNQDGLELDYKVSKGVGRGRQKQPQQHDWTAKTIELVLNRPMDEQPLTENKPVQLLPGLQITAPASMTAKVSVAALSGAERALFRDDGSLAAPASLWGMQNEEAAPYEFSRGMHSAPGPSILELRDVQGKEQVTADTPLLLSTGQSLAGEEFILPVGYDAETGLYYPLGVSDPNGDVRIETLPDESPTGTKSLGGSIKIFFHKVLSKLGIEYEHPQLAVAVFPEEGEDFTYEKDMDEVRAAVAGARRIALFLHGIIGDTLEMAKAVRRTGSEGANLEGVFDLVLTFDYENLNTPISQTGKDLGKRLAEAGLEAGHGKELTLIAHSMGGLVSRWYIEKEGGNEVVSRLIQLGTPNGGSPWASVYELSSVLLARAINGATFLQPYILPLNFLGRFVEQLFVTLQQMHPGDSEFLDKLNDGADPGIPYTIVAGNTKLIPVQLEEKHKKILRKLIARFRKRGHYDALTILLFKMANDIAVAVDSIRGIEGMEQWQTPPRIIEVGCDHISYFADPEGLKALAAAVKEQKETV